MAIIKNVVMRGASKQMGGVVFYTRSGETVARELAPAVSNPRTRPQMENRVKLGNVVGVYRANRAWMPGAFEDKLEKETDYNAFVRMNISNNAVALTKQHIAEGAAVAAPYRITSGSLQSIEHLRTTTGLVTNLYTGALVITSATTVGQLSQALIQNNNGITEGMQLSLVINIQRRNNNTGMPYIVLRTYELIINNASSEPVAEYFPLELVMTQESEGNPLMFEGSTLGDGAAAFILSKTEAGKTKVSSQNMALFGSQATYSIYTSAAAVRAAIESYGETADNFLDSGSASRANVVQLDNYIQALLFNRILHADGDTIETTLVETDTFFIYLAQPIDEITAFRYSIAGGAQEVNFQQRQLEPSGTTILFHFNPGITITEPTEITLELTVGEEVMQFSFIADPTNS